MSGGRLAYHVHVAAENGRVHVFGPRDRVPDWAARKITNRAAWAEQPGPATEPDTVPTGAAAAADGRPAPGATKELWLAYAAARGAQLPAAATKAQIITAVEQAEAESGAGNGDGPGGAEQ